MAALDLKREVVPGVTLCVFEDWVARVSRAAGNEGLVNEPLRQVVAAGVRLGVERPLVDTARRQGYVVSLPTHSVSTLISHLSINEKLRKDDEGIAYSFEELKPLFGADQMQHSSVIEGVFAICSAWGDQQVIGSVDCLRTIASINQEVAVNALRPLLRICLPLDVYLRTRDGVLATNQPRVRAELMPTIMRVVREGCNAADLNQTERQLWLKRVTQRLCEWLMDTAFACFDCTSFSGGPEMKQPYSILRRLANSLSILALYLSEQPDLPKSMVADIIEWFIAQSKNRYPDQYLDVMSLLLCHRAGYVESLLDAIDEYNKAFEIDTAQIEDLGVQILELERDRRRIFEALSGRPVEEADRRQLDRLEERKRQKISEACDRRRGRATNMSGALQQILSAESDEFEAVLRARPGDIDEILTSLVEFFRREQPNHNERVTLLQHAAFVYTMIYKTTGDRHYLKKAKEVLKEILKIREDRFRAHPAEFHSELAILGRVLVTLEQWRGAKVLYDIILRHVVPAYPDTAAEVHCDLGRILFKLDQYNAAIDYVKQANNILSQRYRSILGQKVCPASPEIVSNLELLSTFYHQCILRVRHLLPPARGELENARIRLVERERAAASAEREAQERAARNAIEVATDEDGLSDDDDDDVDSEAPKHRPATPPKRRGTPTRHFEETATDSAESSSAMQSLQDHCKGPNVETTVQLKESQSRSSFSTKHSSQAFPSAQSALMRAREITPYVHRQEHQVQIDGHDKLVSEEECSASSASENLQSVANHAQEATDVEEKDASVDLEESDYMEVYEDDDDDEEDDDDDDEDEEEDDDGEEEDDDDDEEEDDEADDDYDDLRAAYSEDEYEATGDEVTGDEEIDEELLEQMTSISQAPTLVSGESSQYMHSLEGDLSTLPQLPQERMAVIYQNVAGAPPELQRQYRAYLEMESMIEYYKELKCDCDMNLTAVKRVLAGRKLLKASLARLEEELATLDAESENAILGPEELIRRAEIAYHIGSIYKQFNDVNQSIAFYRKALDYRLSALPVGDHTFLIELDDLANIYIRLGQYGETIPLFERAASRLRTMGPRMKGMLAKAVVNQAMAAQLKGDINAAIELYKECISLSRETDDVGLNRIKFQRKLIDCYRQVNSHQEVLAMGKKMLQELPNDPSTLDDACEVRLELCPILIWYKRAGDAEVEFDKAKAHLQSKYSDTYSVQLIPMHRTGAMVAKACGNLREAANYARTAATIMRRGNIHHDLALFCAELYLPILAALARSLASPPASDDGGAEFDDKSLPTEVREVLEEMFQIGHVLLVEYKYPSFTAAHQDQVRAVVHRQMAVAHEIKRQYKLAHDHLARAFELTSPLVQHDLNHREMISLANEMDRLRDLMEKMGIRREEQQDEGTYYTDEGTARQGGMGSSDLVHSYTESNGSQNATEQFAGSSSTVQQDSEKVRRFMDVLGNTHSLASSETKYDEESEAQDEVGDLPMPQDPKSPRYLHGAAIDIVNPMGSPRSEHGAARGNRLRDIIRSFVGSRRAIISYASSQHDSSTVTSPRNGMLSPRNSARSRQALATGAQQEEDARRASKPKSKSPSQPSRVLSSFVACVFCAPPPRRHDEHTA